MKTKPIGNRAILPPNLALKSRDLFEISFRSCDLDSCYIHSMYCNDYASFFYHSVLHQIQQKCNWDYKPLCIQNCRAPLFMTTKWSRNRGGGTTKMPIPCMPINRNITAQITLLRKKIRTLYKLVCTNFVTSLLAG